MTMLTPSELAEIETRHQPDISRWPNHGFDVAAIRSVKLKMYQELCAWLLSQRFSDGAVVGATMSDFEAKTVQIEEQRDTGTCPCPDIPRLLEMVKEQAALLATRREFIDTLKAENANLRAALDDALRLMMDEEPYVFTKEEIEEIRAIARGEKT